jgi:hypothetical protein
MRNYKKLILSVVSAALLLGATPLLAELEGNWAGDGEGFFVYPPGAIVQDTVYAWQSWQGTVEDGTFWGTWYDAEGHAGNFKGSIILMSLTSAYCEGTWTWVDTSADPPIVKARGPFNMTFYYQDDDETCSGNWAYNNIYDGTMQGSRVD